MSRLNINGLTELTGSNDPVSIGQIQYQYRLTDLKRASDRIEAIDLLRGFIMIIMALDHTREFFHFDAFLYSPTDLARTTVPVFFTRWITHLCAPTFIFLSGTSAYFIAQRKSRRDTAIFLLTRGLWLIVLQLTIVRLAWNFDLYFHYNAHSILSVIGCCMILMAGLIYLPLRALLFVGLAIVAGHHLADGILFEPNTTPHIWWAFLHIPGSYNLNDGYIFSFVYPLIPWIGVMVLGYCAGRLYQSDFLMEERRELLFLVGGFCILTFVVLRAVNVYGDPSEWTIERDDITTLLSFFNLTKYPPSFLYLCVTLGVSLIVLALLEGQRRDWWKPVSIFGKVALFYYVLHLFVIHLLSLVVIVTQGIPWQATIYPGPVANGSPLLVGEYGFTLPVVYFIWMTVIMILYPFCLSWNSMRLRNKSKWWVRFV